MKKTIITTVILALVLPTTMAYAKGFKMSTRKSAPATLSKAKSNSQQQNQQQTQKDADFDNTAYKPIPSQAQTAQQTQASSSRANGLLTGVAAGYLLNEALSANEAQAQTQQQPIEPLNQLSEQVAQTAPAIPTFKAIEPQADPFLIEKTSGYLRYCLNGVQYLVPTANTQLAPTLMVDKNNAPAQCAIAP